MRPHPRTLRILVVGYVVKTLLITIAWVMVPDLPERAMAALRSTFSTTEP